jgi:uncharacterized membrane protein YagU involved in acid resistance
MNVLQGDRLWTDMPATEWVGPITPDIDNLRALRLNDQPTHGLAQVADPVMCHGFVITHARLSVITYQGTTL